MAILPNQARNLNGEILKIFRPIFKRFFYPPNNKFPLHYRMCHWYRQGQPGVLYEWLDGISGTWPKLRSSLSYMHEME